jgi:hypothetical protein
MTSSSLVSEYVVKFSESEVSKRGRLFKKMEITGHVTGTDWTVFLNLPAAELHAVKIWLVVWALVRDRGRRPDMKGRCECTEYVVAGSCQGVVLKFGRLLELLATPTLTTHSVSKHFTSLRTWTEPWELPKRWKRDRRFGTWNVKRLYGAGQFTTVVR